MIAAGANRVTLCCQNTEHALNSRGTSVKARQSGSAASDREQSYACVNRHWELETSNCITLNFLLLFQKRRGKSSLIGT